MHRGREGACGGSSGESDAHRARKESVKASASGSFILINASRPKGGLPALFVVGPSGSGKSSLVRGGIAPELTDPGVVADVDCWRSVRFQIKCDSGCEQTCDSGGNPGAAGRLKANRENRCQARAVAGG